MPISGNSNSVPRLSQISANLHLDRELSEEEFEENLKAALKPPSKGVVFWSWAHLEQDPGKKSIISKWVKKE